MAGWKGSCERAAVKQEEARLCRKSPSGVERLVFRLSLTRTHAQLANHVVQDPTGLIFQDEVNAVGAIDLQPIQDLSLNRKTRVQVTQAVFGSDKEKSLCLRLPDILAHAECIPDVDANRCVLQDLVADGAKLHANVQ